MDVAFQFYVENVQMGVWKLMNFPKHIIKQNMIVTGLNCCISVLFYEYEGFTLFW